MAGGRRIRNLGILAHVDAGKTTLTEHLLFLSGKLRRDALAEAGAVATSSSAKQFLDFVAASTRGVCGHVSDRQPEE